MQKNHYLIGQSVVQLCSILDISSARVLRRLGLASDYLTHEGKGCSAATYFALFDAVQAESGRDDLPLFLGKTFAHGPFVPAILAFSCSPNIEIGMARLAVFKPLIAPCAISVERQETSVSLSFGSSVPRMEMPASMGLFELVYFLECSRLFTAHPIIPTAIDVPMGASLNKDLIDFFGVTPTRNAKTALHLSIEDATRPLISENAVVLEGLEQDLNRQLAQQHKDTALETRVRHSLIEMLPAGQASIDAVCRRLNMSKRSLQRHLRNEATSFQDVLDSLRRELSLYYLQQNTMSIEEISYLLAYRDPNSFYRAFQSWTGMTPAQAREPRPANDLSRRA